MAYDTSSSTSLEKEALFRQFARVCRLVQKLALERRSTLGRDHKIGYGKQAGKLTLLRAEFDFARAVYVSCQQQALCDLDREVATKRLNAKGSAVRPPKIG